MDALWRVERIYRKQLVEEPGNTVARVSLAWCLFMQALHRAGQESAVNSVLELALPADPGVSDGHSADRDSAVLLQDCLRQALAVLQLSPDPRDHLDVERLQALVKLSGGAEILADAEEQAHRILTQLTREMMNSDVARSRRSRRVANRRSGDPL
jgi:hypothetical protein